MFWKQACTFRRAPRHFLLGKGHPTRKLYTSTFVKLLFTTFFTIFTIEHFKGTSDRCNRLRYLRDVSCYGHHGSIRISEHTKGLFQTSALGIQLYRQKEQCTICIMFPNSERSLEPKLEPEADISKMSGVYLSFCHSATGCLSFVSPARTLCRLWNN